MPDANCYYSNNAELDFCIHENNIFKDYNVKFVDTRQVAPPIHHGGHVIGLMQLTLVLAALLLATKMIIRTIANIYLEKERSIQLRYQIEMLKQPNPLVHGDPGGIGTAKGRLEKLTHRAWL